MLSRHKPIIELGILRNKFKDTYVDNDFGYVEENKILYDVYLARKINLTH